VSLPLVFFINGTIIEMTESVKHFTAGTKLRFMPSVSSEDSRDPPLHDIKVVDLTQVLAGPFATMTLGDLGAEVIKIEAVGRGDRARHISPIPEYFDTANRNKRSIEINLKTEAGQAVARDLLEEADVFIESTKPGRITDFGLDYEEVVQLNPSIVYCSITGFGAGSPYEGIPAWDILIQGMSGIMSMTGTEETPPLWSGLPSGDLISAMYAVQSVLAALYARERGEIPGEHIEVPMLDAAISWLTMRAGHTFGTDEPFPRSGVHHPSLAPFGIFSCAEQSIVIGAGTDSLWERFCEAIDRPALATRDEFADLQSRLDNRDQLIDIIESTLENRSIEYWLDRFHEFEVPAGPIHDTKTIWEDPHVKQRGLHRKMAYPDRDGHADVIDSPVRFEHLDTNLEIPPERLGASTSEILESHGYSEDTIARLRDDDVIG